MAQIEFVVVGCKETYNFQLNVDVYCYCCNQLVLNGMVLKSKLFAMSGSIVAVVQNYLQIICKLP